MRPLIIVLPHAIFFWVIWIWAFLPEQKIVSRARKAAKEKGSKDGGSIGVIMGLGGASMFLAFLAAFRTTGFSEAVRVPLYYLGLAIMIAGGVLRRVCWRTLGEYFTGDVKARADQPVIQSGPYRWVRHPSYTAAIMLFIGIGLTLGNWISLALSVIGPTLSYVYRVRVEERALLAEIGAPYAEFMRTRKRFIPYIV